MTKDQINLESFFGHLLEDFKAGELSKEQAIGGLVAFSIALNEGDFDAARRWAEQGRKLARDLISLDHAALLLSRPVGNLPH
ncbi:hypothetical protein [Burkholderia gladioli]|uniref:hypothetical protein n=1 Tax=Burkholderia gladioli TaxID=28095 RepID=UPI00163E77ED|nr:hypothetical protein [Burkholderia gladioli]